MGVKMNHTSLARGKSQRTKQGTKLPADMQLDNNKKPTQIALKIGGDFLASE